jgi:hypothetical protein
MALKIPKNQILTSKYTSGGEYVTDKEYKNYQGYYYEVNNNIYAGKEFNTTASVLLKVNSPDVNKLITNPFTSIYGAISGVKLPQTNISSIPFIGEEKLRYFIKKVNVNPINIKEVNKASFEQTKSDPIYQTLEVNFKYNMTDIELDNLDKQMPGIKVYLQSDLIPNTSSDEMNPYIR